MARVRPPHVPFRERVLEGYHHRVPSVGLSARGTLRPINRPELASVRPVVRNGQTRVCARNHCAFDRIFIVFFATGLCDRDRGGHLLRSMGRPGMR